MLYCWLLKLFHWFQLNWINMRVENLRLFKMFSFINRIHSLNSNCSILRRKINKMQPRLYIYMQAISPQGFQDAPDPYLQHFKMECLYSIIPWYQRVCSSFDLFPMESVLPVFQPAGAHYYHITNGSVKDFKHAENESVKCLPPPPPLTGQPYNHYTGHHH